MRRGWKPSKASSKARPSRRGWHRARGDISAELAAVVVAVVAVVVVVVGPVATIPVVGHRRNWWKDVEPMDVRGAAEAQREWRTALVALITKYVHWRRRLEFT